MTFFNQLVSKEGFFINLLKQSYYDFRSTYKKYLTFEFIYLLLTSLIFVPLIAYIFNRVLVAVSSGVLLNTDLFKIVLSYQGVIGLFSIFTIAVLVIFIEFGVLIVIAQQKYFQQDISIFEAFMTTVRAMPSIIGLGLVKLMFLLLFIIPFIEIPIGSTLIEDIAFPRLVMDGIYASYLYLVFYMGAIALFFYLFIRWIFTLHCIIIEGKHTSQAIRSSMELTRKNITRILLNLLVLNILFYVLGLLLIYAVTY